MRVEYMRSIDRHIGRVIAVFLSLFLRGRNEQPGRDTRCIVISKYFGIGSITLSTPLLQSIRESFPDAKIHFLTFRRNAELPALYPFIDGVIAIRGDSLMGFLADTLKAVFRLRRMKVGLFIDMEFFSHYSALMALLSGARHRVGFHTSLLPRGRLLTHRVSFNPHRYVVEAFKELGRKVGAAGEHPLYRPVLDVYSGRISKWISENGLREYGYAVFNIRGSEHLGSLNKWPAEKWARLAGLMVGEAGRSVVMTGVEKNRDIDEVMENLDAGTRKFVHNIAGVFDIGEFMALLEKSRVLITVDSGPLHIAQSLGVPCVALFGPENPVLYGPRGKFSRTVYLGLYCSPCYNVLEGKKAECTSPLHNECMERIEVDMVWNETAGLMKEL